MGSPVSVPHLFAMAHGVPCEGEHPCFFCGAPAGLPADEYVRDSFTGRDGVARPSSQWVCAGCVLCLRESCELTYHDDTRRTQARSAVRGHSWVITAGRAVAATRAHLSFLRESCLAPPASPCAVVLADSGQKHLLYRGVLAWPDSGVMSATLEGERVDYRPADLAGRLVLCERLMAATGKPALAEPPTVRFLLSVCAYHGDGESLCLQWESVHEEPLSRLARWLCPGREECQVLHPATTPGVTGQ